MALINRTADGDNRTGTSKADQMYGFAVLFVGAGDDEGGEGDDELRGGDAGDSLFGKECEDHRLFGDAETDIVFGAGGEDSLRA